jgi:regulator of CtrA degradation
MVPKSLRGLIERSMSLQQRVGRLDATIHAAGALNQQENPVEQQLGLLKAAFERES